MKSDQSKTKAELIQELETFRKRLRVQDITEREQVEEALRESEKRFRTFFENEPEYCYMISKNGEVLDINKSTLNTLGYNKDEIVGKPFLTTIYAPLSRERAKNLFQKWLKTGHLKNEEINIITKDGEERTVLLSANAIKDDEGNILNSISIQRDITELKRAEKSLLREHELFETTYNTILDAILTMDMNFNIVSCNKAVQNIFGYTPEELVGENYSIIVAPKMFEDPVEKTQQLELFEKGYFDTDDFYFKRKDGEIFPARFTAAIYKDSKGNPIGLVGTVHDITKRKRAEEKLRQSEINFRNTFDLSSDAIFIKDKNLRIIDTNKSAEKLSGYSHNELLSIPEKTLGDREKNDYELADKYIKEALKGIPQRFEWWGLKKDGTSFPEDIVIDKTVYNGEEVLLFTLRDMTERKRAEEALRESEERYRAIFEQAADSIVLVDAETGQLVEFNDGAYENLGYTREQFEKLTIPDFEVIESAEEVTKHIEKIVKEGADIFETKHRKVDGDIRDIQVSSKALSIGGRDFVQSIWRDITERKQAQENLLQSRDQLRQLSRRLDSIREEERTKMAGDIHDQLGQTVTAMQINLSMLKNEIPENEKLQHEKINDMLEIISSLDNSLHQMYFELRPYMLDELGLTPAIEWYSREFEKRTSIKCKLTLQPERIQEDREWSTSVYRIYQEIFTNIARHAKATSITVNLEQKTDKIILTVKDDGKGITPGEMNAPDALGILSMRERVLHYNGELNIKGIKGKGTVVRIELPFSQKGVES